MENASKALIIAGSILIAIVIIGVAIYIFTTSQKPLDESASQMDAQAVASYNSRFEAYAGTNKKGSEIVELIAAVNSNNSQSDNKIEFWVSGSNYTNSPSSAKSLINVAQKYTVTISYNNEKKGLISSIKVI